MKYEVTAQVREKLGDCPLSKRIYALEKWAVSHGYDGYKAIQRRTKRDRQQQVSMAFYKD